MLLLLLFHYTLHYMSIFQVCHYSMFISESEHQCHIAPTASQVMVASLPIAVLLSHLILLHQVAVLVIALETNHRSKVSKQKKKNKY